MSTCISRNNADIVEDIKNIPILEVRAQQTLHAIVQNQEVLVGSKGLDLNNHDVIPLQLHFAHNNARTIKLLELGLYKSTIGCRVIYIYIYIYILIIILCTEALTLFSQ